MNIETGDPVVLTDNTGLPELDINTKGWANSVTTIPGDGTYIFFMPEDSKQMYVVGASRLTLDEEAKAAGVELSPDTIHKE